MNKPPRDVRRKTEHPKHEQYCNNRPKHNRLQMKCFREKVQLSYHWSSLERACHLRSFSVQGDELMNMQRITSAIGRGLIAGLAGTAAITISSTIEMKLRGRKPSTTPGKVAGKVLGVRARDQEGMMRFSNIIHWDYGMSWGLFLSAAELAGLSGTPASLAHFAAVWGAALA